MSTEYIVRTHNVDDIIVPDIKVSGFSRIRKLIVEASNNKNIWMLQFFRPDGMFSKVYIPFEYVTYEKHQEHLRYIEEKRKAKLERESKLMFPDAYASKQYWLDCLKPPAMAGRLDNIPARKPVTKKDYDIAQKQNYALSRRSYGVPDLSHIDWSK